VRGTLAAIEQRLVRDGGLVMRRWRRRLPPGEGAFLACSFWLADNYILQQRFDDARVLFERLLALQNDLGLLAEEYDPRARRMLGNFPQAFSHVGLINPAINLASVEGSAAMGLQPSEG
jgi:GH15 family glucan-1,4-alpha-glucosidase